VDRVLVAWTPEGEGATHIVDLGGRYTSRTSLAAEVVSLRMPAHGIDYGHFRIAARTGAAPRANRYSYGWAAGGP
jgi:hypothetical protein